MKDFRTRAVGLAAVMLLAGCASASSDHISSGAQRGGSGAASQAPSNAKTPTPATVAQQLIDEARVPTAAVRTAKSPTKLLRHPPTAPGVTNVTVRARWWRIDEPAAAAYAWVSQHQSAAVSSIGSTSSSGPSLADVEHDADFAPPHLPATVNSAQLTMSVVPLTARISAIAAFAVVVRQPPRPPAEDVPATVDSVMVVTRRTTGQLDGGSILGRTTLTGVAAARLVHDFDALTVQPPGEVFSCPLSVVTQTAFFRFGNQLWTATTGACVGVDVTLNGHRLPTLDISNDFSRDLRAAFGHRFPKPTGPQPMTGATAPTSSVNS
jgi:hypothetical protein